MTDRRKKKTSSREGKKNNGWLVYLGVVMVIVGVIIGGLDWYKRTWSDKFVNTLLIVGEDRLTLVGWNPQESRGVVFKIAGNLLVPVVGTSGELEAASIWKFGEGEGKPVEIVRRSMEAYLGVKIDKVMENKQVKDEGLKEVKKSVWKLIWQPRSGLGWSDRVGWWSSVGEAREDQLAIHDIATEVGVKEIQPDGKEVLVIDKKRLGVVIKKDLASSGLLASTVRASLINGSGTVGMTKILEQQLLSAGLLVMDLDEGEVVSDWCLFKWKGEVNEEVEQWLREKMDCKKSDKVNLEKSTGDLVIVVGQKWAEAYRR